MSERHKARRERLIAQGKCGTCGAKLLVPGKKECLRCLAKNKAKSKVSRLGKAPVLVVQVDDRPIWDQVELKINFAGVA